MTSYKIKGIILTSKAFFESDKLLDCFTTQYGKIKCLAKSAQKTTSQFGGKCDPFTLIEGVIYSGKSFNILSQVSLVHSYSNLRLDFNKLQLALFYLKVITLSTDYNQKNNELYTLLITQLNILDQSTNIETAKKEFFKQFLSTEGLLESNKKEISEKEFIKILSEYTNKFITPPLHLK